MVFMTYNFMEIDLFSKITKFIVVLSNKKQILYNTFDIAW